jgi:PAS domain S-box-containing protein
MKDESKTKRQLIQELIALRQQIVKIEKAEAKYKQTEEALRRSEEEAKRLAEENAVMAEIGRIISSTLNIEEIYERFIEEVRKLIQGDRITIAIANPDGSTLTLAYAWGLEVAGRKTGNVFPLAGTTSEKAMRTRSSIMTQEENMEEVLKLFPGLSSYYKAGFQSMIVVPLISKNNVIGTLHFRSIKPKAYTQSDVLLAERVGNEIAGAIANAQLFAERKQAEASLRKSEEEAKKLAVENAIMAEIGRIISSTLDIEEVYERFAEEMRRLIPFDRLGVNVIDRKNYNFSIPYVLGPQVTSRRAGEVIPLAGTGTEEVMRTQTSLFIHEENREAIISRFPGLAPIFKAGLQSIMIVPLSVKNDVIGVMNIQMAKPNAYTEMDLRLAERVSSQVAGAIANTLLFVEHKRSEEALRVSEERYRSILESIEDGYYEVDIAGNFTFFNDSMCQILGYSKEEMMGMNNRQYTDQKNAKKLYQAFNKVFRTEQSAKGYEWEIIKKDGTKRDVDASVSLIKDISGNRIGFRGIVRDIAERKQAEKEMAALQEQLRQSQKIEAIGQLAGGIAHDFNNAITLIKTCSQLALMDLKPGDPLRQTFEMIDKATQQSANLTRQLLAFSRRQIMEMKVLDLNSLLGDMDKMLHRVIGEDIELVSMLAGDLGRVKVDPGQMEQVVLNLVLNSRDAMPQGGKLTIETANVELNEKYVNNHVGVKPGSYVRVSVSDTGVGMTPEVRERVFEPFFTTKEKGKGTGLGLSTVYGIVKQSKGNIWVYSEPGKGTTFKVYLPQVEEPLEEEKEKARRLERELPHGGETVLVAEDDGDVRSLVVQILKKQGYKVLEAANGEEAFMICEKHEGAIDLLVTDVVMPVMSGRELTDRLLLLQPKIKILYMSGYTDEAIVRHGVLEEGVNFFQKPFSMEALVLKVREVLDK